MTFRDLGLQPGNRSYDRPSDDAISQTATSGLYARFGKRVFDLVLSLFMLPVLVPVLAILWLWVRCDGGSALFCQTRVGRNGKTFACYKFRTMILDAERVLEQMCASDPVVAAEWHAQQKLRHDPRITRVGRILRKTSLDELPQILNVLTGDMSLVGPRPFLPAQKAIYDEAGGKAYYHLRPGVTGMWQVFGRHDTTFASRVRFDEAYGAAVSLWADASLILRTVKVVLHRTGT